MRLAQISIQLFKNLFQIGAKIFHVTYGMNHWKMMTQLSRVRKHRDAPQAGNGGNIPSVLNAMRESGDAPKLRILELELREAKCALQEVFHSARASGAIWMMQY